MQENLRELVGHIQHTAASVATRHRAARSAENVNAATTRSALIRKIALGAGTSRPGARAQRSSARWRRASRRPPLSAEDAALAAADDLGAAEQGSKAARWPARR
jgi:hypothetical protein